MIDIEKYIARTRQEKTQYRDTGRCSGWKDSWREF